MYSDDYDYPQVDDKVILRDGREMTLTDVPEQGPYETIDRTAYFEEGKMIVTSSMPAETIVVGTTAGGKTIVTDMSEIVGVLRTAF